MSGRGEVGLAWVGGGRTWKVDYWVTAAEDSYDGCDADGFA